MEVSWWVFYSKECGVIDGFNDVEVVWEISIYVFDFLLVVGGGEEEGCVKEGDDIFFYFFILWYKNIDFVN